MIGSCKQSLLTFSQTLRQARTGRDTSSEHHGKSDEQMRNLIWREHWLDVVSNTGRNLLIWKEEKSRWVKLATARFFSYIKFGIKFVAVKISPQISE